MLPTESTLDVSDIEKNLTAIWEAIHKIQGEVRHHLHHDHKEDNHDEVVIWLINILMFFWSILGQRKTSLVVFHEKGELVQLSFWPILFLMAYIRPLESILAKKNN